MATSLTKRETVTVNGITLPKPPNGAIVLEAKDFKHPSDWFLKTVICYLPGNNITPFVVWSCNLQTEIPGYFSGSYYGKLIDAAKDFDKRHK